MGLSGAVIEIMPDGTVRKSAHNVGLQGTYCRMFSPPCPDVIDIYPDFYTMERLFPYQTPEDGDVFETMIYVYSALMKDIWSVAKARCEWQWQLIDWILEVAPQYPILNMLEKLYPYSSNQMNFIHGDPTLSNLLLRRDELVIADPIPPHGKIPGYPEVDIGKTFQSLIGWEHVVFDWPMPSRKHAVDIVRMFPEDTQRKGMFWLFIHALRILPYARARKDPVALEWAESVAKLMYPKLMRVSPCTMLMILMEHSQTLKRQYATRMSGPE